MTDEKNLESMNEEVEVLESDLALAVIQDTMDTMLAAASVDTVYGSPIERDDTLIIPAAEVVAVMGFGLGSGYGRSEEENQDESAGSAGGGAGRVFSRPVAVVVASPEGVRIDPVVDFTKIALAGLTAGVFMIGMFMRLINPKKTLKDLQEGDWG